MAAAEPHAAPPASPAHRARHERLIFWFSFLTYSYFYQGADQSTAARFDLMRAIVERRTLWIDGYCGYNTADIISLGGHYYSVKAPGGTFSGILQWITVSALLSPLFSRHEALYWALTTWLTTVLSTSLIVAIACVAMYRLVMRLGGGPGRAITCAILMAFGTIVFPYATEMTGEPIAGACALIAFYLIATQRQEDEAGRAMFAGIMAGWAVLCDFPTILIAAALSIYAVWRVGFTRHLIGFAVGASAVALVLLANNQAAFGNPLFLSYEAYKLAGNSQFPEQAVGFVGLTMPRLGVLFKILIDPQRGLFFCNPILLLSIPGLLWMWLRRGVRIEAAVITFIAVSMVLFNAAFGESIISWGGGTATGPRQIVAAIPFMVVAIAFLPSRWNWPIAILGLASVFAMLMATAVEPHFPYEYANPLRDFAFPAYLRGDFAYNRDAYFAGKAIVDESTAFNLGKLAGLAGPFQLWPLGVLWGVAGWLLVRTNQRKWWRRLAVIGGVALLILPALTGTVRVRLRSTPYEGLRGRYYRELTPNGHPPHLDRVDSTLNFGSVAALGALPAPSRVIWTGTLIAPRTGSYRFAIVADDLGWLTIDGTPVIRDPGDTAQAPASGEVYLTAGPHRIEAGERNLAGDAVMRLGWQPPGAQPTLVPSSALRPD